MVVRGRIASGTGGHAHWMRLHAELYEAKTGARLYPGTLNVVLDRDWYVSGDVLRLEPPEYPVPLSITPCAIEGVDAFVIRTDKNDRGEGDHAPNVLEIAASGHLRSVLKLNDGDLVEVELPAQVDERHEH
jgi:riboflavin kinase, archaea type